MQVNEIVQITDEEHAWYPALLIVSEVKSWGVLAYMHVVHSNLKYEGNVGRAYIRIKNEQVEHCGYAVIVAHESEENP